MSDRVGLLLQLADDELILGWRNSEWTGIAPFLEEDVAFSSIAQNEIGHARALYELVARELGTDADARAPLALRDGGRDPARGPQGLRRLRDRRHRRQDRSRGGLPPYPRGDVG